MSEKIQSSDINDNEDTTDACSTPSSQGSFLINTIS